MTTVIRFIRGTGLPSDLIVAQEKTAMPFTPSHVEILSRDGKSYFGSMFEGGVQYRPLDHEKLSVDPITGKRRELLLPLDTTPEGEAAAWKWADGKIGEPYDSAAIFGFVIPLREHTLNHAICSACATLFLRTAGWFADPLAAPAHLIDPRDLLLIISGRMKVPM